MSQTNVERANAPSQEVVHQRQAEGILALLDKGEVQRNRQRLQDHRARFREWDQRIRKMTTRCAYCGLEADPMLNLRQTARDWAGAMTQGHIWTSMCRICTGLYRSYDGTLNQQLMVLWKSIQRANRGDWYPAKNSANSPFARVGLSWAGWAFRARTAGHEEDPGDPEVPYSHLEGIKPSAVLFYYPEIEPWMTRQPRSSMGL